MTCETPTPAEAFAQADTKLDQLQAKLAAARADVESLRQAVDKERTLYRSALAQVELAGAPPTSRGALVAKESELTTAEDRLAGLQEAVQTFQVEWNRAKADALLERVGAIRAEAARRQERIHQLEAEITPRQKEIGAHGGWILTELAKAQHLENEARAL